MGDNKSISVKVVVIGEPSVGKTTLTKNFVGSTLKTDYLMTLGADISESKILVEDNTTLDVQIWDLAGQENFLPLTKQFLTGAQGAIVVFDLTRDYTFDKVNMWLEQLQEANPKLDNNIPFIIVGNKEDLETYITVDDGIVAGFIEYVNRHHIFSQTDAEYVKTSAKTGSKVEMAFQRLGAVIMKNFNLTDPNAAPIDSDKSRDQKIIEQQTITEHQLEEEEDATVDKSYQTYSEITAEKSPTTLSDFHEEKNIINESNTEIEDFQAQIKADYAKLIEDEQKENIEPFTSHEIPSDEEDKIIEKTLEPKLNTMEVETKTDGTESHSTTKITQQPTSDYTSQSRPETIAKETQANFAVESEKEGEEVQKKKPLPPRSLKSDDKEEEETEGQKLYRKLFGKKK